MKLFRGRFFFGLGVTLAALVAVGGGYYLLRYQVWTAYRSWSFGRMNGMARDFIAAKDPRNALLTVRKILAKRPNDADAWRLAVQASEMSSSNEAVVFQRNLCRVQKTTANFIELMRLSLKYEAYGYGVDAITAVAQDARGMPEYHRLAAKIYRHVHRELPAKYHLISLLSLMPDDVGARVGLAEIEFEIAPDKLPADWAKRVDDLAHIPEAVLPASLLQLRAAVARRSVAEAAALAAKLKDREDLTLAQRLNILEAAYLYDASAAAGMLGKLQQQVADHPVEVVQVMDFLAGQAKAETVRTWYPNLPDEVKENERVKFATAQSLQALRDWPGLEALLRGAPWKTEEYLRESLLAYVYRLTDRPVESAGAWKIAMISAGQDPRKITRLLRSVETWRWEEERYELMWRLFNLMPTNTAVQQFLVAHEFRDGKTVNLNKIYARLVEADPADEAARNNFAYTSLLLDTNPGRAQTIARELFKKHPENVSYRTTYALALHKQGRSREALALMEELDDTTRAAAVPMVHEAAFAAAAGELDRAAVLLPQLAKAQLLPEQRQLATQAGLEIARHQRVKGKQTELLALAEMPANEAGGWLGLLSNQREQASVDFKLSDSYYRERNFPALRELLQNGHWAQDDHLRYALLAFVERAESHGGAASDYWRQAFGSAGRNPVRLKELEALASKWKWTDERMDVVDRIFERDAGNRARLTELLDYYRSHSRTSDMARVLWLYVDQTNATGTEAAWCVYYSLLCEMNVSPAQTLALRVYDRAPNDPRHRVAYAFALWRQKRSAEALKLVQDLGASDLNGMQVSLVEAGALLELGRKQEARKILDAFTPVNAMPEEINLAATLSRQAGLSNALAGLTLK